MSLSEKKKREIEEEEKYRNEIKTKISDSDTEKKNKLIAALLAFFLGTFGIHKFYMGETGKGIFYLLFCWTGIPTILGVVECIDYLLISDKKFQSKCK